MCRIQEGTGDLTGIVFTEKKINFRINNRYSFKNYVIIALMR